MVVFWGQNPVCWLWRFAANFSQNFCSKFLANIKKKVCTNCDKKKWQKTWIIGKDALRTYWDACTESLKSMNYDRSLKVSSLTTFYMWRFAAKFQVFLFFKCPKFLQILVTEMEKKNQTTSIWKWLNSDIIRKSSLPQIVNKVLLSWWTFKTFDQVLKLPTGFQCRILRQGICLCSLA